MSNKARRGVPGCSLELPLLWLFLAAFTLSCATVVTDDVDPAKTRHIWDERPPLLQAANPVEEAEQTTEATAKFFESMDNNGDGQIEAAEAVAFVSAQLRGDDQFATAEEVTAAAASIMKGMDTDDPDPFISLDEFAEQKPHMLQGNRLIDWVRHGLQLPQYTENFRSNGITVQDFPLLAGPDGMEILKEDLHVSSKLHREKILRSIRRQMLGLGHPPSPPESVTCVAVSCSSIVVNWEPPKDKGSPPFHKYVVERRIQLLEGWSTVAAPDGDDTELVLSDLGTGGAYEFRITAWSTITHSSYGQSSPCRIEPQECAAMSPALGSKGVDKEESSWWSFWVWFNTLVSVVVYSLVFFLKHVSGQDTALAENVRKGVGNVSSWGFKRLESFRISASDSAPLSSSSPLKGRAARGGSLRSSPAANGLDRMPPEPFGEDERQEGREGEEAEDPDDPMLPPLSPIYPEGFPRELVASPTKFWVSNGSPPASFSALNLNEGGGSPSELHVSSSAIEFGRPDYLAARDGYDTDSSPSQSRRSHNGPALQVDGKGMRRVNSGSRLDPQRGFDAAAGQDRASGAPGMRGGSPDPDDKASRCRCHHPGCHRVWNNWASVIHLKRMATSHYCGSCQRSFCGKHTRISPHGSLGSCAIESNCYCCGCFARMPPEVQARLESTNRLVASSSQGASGSGAASPVASLRRGGGGESSCALSACSNDDVDGRLEDLEVQIAARQRSVANWAKARNAVLPSRMGGKPPMAPQQPHQAGGAASAPRGGPPSSRQQQQTLSPRREPSPKPSARSSSPFWKRRA